MIGVGAAILAASVPQIQAQSAHASVLPGPVHGTEIQPRCQYDVLGGAATVYTGTVKAQHVRVVLVTGTGAKTVEAGTTVEGQWTTTVPGYFGWSNVHAWVNGRRCTIL